MKIILLIIFSFLPLYSQSNGVKIFPDNLVAHTYFGNAISYNGNTIVVGALTGSYDMIGSVYFIEAIDLNWKVVSQICDTSSILTDQSGFGASVSISDKYLVIGNPRENGHKGCAYICKLSDLSLVNAIKLSPHRNGDEVLFGHSADISDNHLIVGAMNECSFGINPGAVYIYQSIDESWNLTDRLTSNDSLSCDGYGFDVAINDSFAVVGSSGDDDNGMAAGCVYVYQNNDDNWNFLYKVYSPDASGGDYFGQSISLRENLLLVGSPGERGLNLESGKAYLFLLKHNGYLTIDELIGKDIDDEAGFGFSVSLDEYLIAVSAPNRYYDDGIGAVYIFKKTLNSWDEVRKISSPDNQIKNYFGNSTYLKDNTLIVGSMLDDEKAVNAGAVYIYDLSDITHLSNKKETILNSYILYQNYPNPFNNTTKISFQLPKITPATLTIYDITGRKVKELVNNRTFTPGRHSVVWEGTNEDGRIVGSGIYLYEIKGELGRAVRKMLLVK